MATLSQIRAAEKKMMKAQNVIQRYVDNHGEPVSDADMEVHTRLAGDLQKAIAAYLALLTENGQPAIPKRRAVAAR